MRRPRMLRFDVDKPIRTQPFTQPPLLSKFECLRTSHSKLEEMAATTEVPSPDSPVSTSAFSFHPALAKGSDKLVTWAMLDDPTQGGTYWKLDLEENGIWDKLYDEDMVPLEISFWTSAASNDWTSSQNAAPTKKTKKSKPFENVYLRPEFEQLGGSPMKDEPATTPPSYRLDLQFDDAAVKTFLETMTTNFPDCCDGCYQTYHEVFDRGSKEIVVARYDGKPVTVWDVLTSVSFYPSFWLLCFLFPISHL